MALTEAELSELLFYADRHGLLTYKEGMPAIWQDALATHYPQLDMRLATEAMQLMAAQLEEIPARGIRASHLIKYAKQISLDRQALIPIELPAGLTPSQEQEWARAWTFAVGRGASREAAKKYCEQATDYTPPPQLEGDPIDVEAALNKYRKQFGKQTA